MRLDTAVTLLENKIRTDCSERVIKPLAVWNFLSRYVELDSYSFRSWDRRLRSIVIPTKND